MINFLGFNLIKSALIIFAVLLYWKFIFFPYHRRDFTPISCLTAGVITVLAGAFWFFNGNVNFMQISYVCYVMLLFLIVSFTLVSTAISKHSLDKDADIFLTWAKKTFPYIPFWCWMIVAFPAMFFVVAFTRVALGAEYVFLWALIFLEWIRSNYQVVRKKILK